MESDIRQLKVDINSAAKQLHIEALAAEIVKLKTKSHEASFWLDSNKAADTMQRISKLEKRITPWQGLITAVEDILELTELNDNNLASELESNLASIKQKFDDLRQQLMYSGIYDDHGAIIAISAGAGGTDAQDWTQILYRMYTRYFDKNAWKYKVVDESLGEEAGIKNIVLEVDGDDFVYGKLSGEHGVHRLVRLSPFNSDNLRQTSFAKVEVSPKIDSPSEVDIDEKELKMDVYRSGGHGGQSVNTTDSAVRITHLPSGITVAIQNERSQLQNKETAMRVIRSRLAQLQLEQHAHQLSELKGANQSAEWGNQIRSYVMHPYKQIKDLRTKYETSDIDSVLSGELEPFINAYQQLNLAADIHPTDTSNML